MNGIAGLLRIFDLIVIAPIVYSEGTLLQSRLLQYSALYVIFISLLVLGEAEHGIKAPIRFVAGFVMAPLWLYMGILHRRPWLLFFAFLFFFFDARLFIKQFKEKSNTAMLQ